VPLLIEKGDEMKRFVEGLSEINWIKDKAKKKVLYSCSKEERENNETGQKYSLLAVYKRGLDPSQPNRFIRFQEIIPVDVKGEIISESHQVIKQASIYLISKGVEKYQASRGLKVRAAAMNAKAGHFDLAINKEE
jgi:hypothetical protein